MKILIKGGRILDAASGTDKQLDIIFEDGVIIKTGEDLAAEPADEKIDATGLWVMPGLIDMHVHLRDPGYRHKETIASGTKSAAMGGFTTICPMANTDPVADNKTVVNYIRSTALKEGAVNVAPVGSITKNLAGEGLSAIDEMAAAGICAISDDGKFVENPALMHSAMSRAKMFNLPVLSHCEDSRLTGKGQINAGPHANAMGLAGIPSITEEVIVARDIILAKDTGAHLHICHVSTAGSLEYIRKAKSEASNITAEVCPHHFTLCDEDIADYDANFKMSPPLRGKLDVAALKAALKDGTIDVIATDHAPHHEDDKNCKFEQAQNGIIGLETAVPLCITELINTKVLTPLEWAAKMTVNPAKILRLNKGNLGVGTIADITIIDPNFSWAIDKSLFASCSKNTPFNGRKVMGKVMYTIVAGKLIVKNGKCTI